MAEPPWKTVKRAGWAGLLLALSLLSSGCASLTPLPRRGRHLNYAPHEVASPVWTQGSSAVTGVDPGSEASFQTRQAVVSAILDVSGSTRRVAVELSRLKASRYGIGGRYAHVFGPFVDHGLQQWRWIDAELAAATRLPTLASEVEDPDLELALLRLAGPRLEAAMLGCLLLSAWADFLNLADVMLRECPSCGKETLLRRLDGLRRMLQPPMTALSSLEPEQLEAAAADLPALMGHFSNEFTTTHESMRVAMENFEKMLMLKEAIESLTMLSAMRLALPRLPPAVPVTLGAGLLVSSGGVMVGTQVVVSAEWVEMMRRLVQAGVLSASVVSSAVRVRAGQVLMAQAKDELPPGVREALGDSPEVRGMRVTGRAGAGMAEPPRHHVLPQEHRQWFEQRGFTGEMSIDQFCVRMERAGHEAIHGGGDWRLGRTWPGEWNQMIMRSLYKAEARAGRMLTQNEVLDIVAKHMRDAQLPIHFTPWRGR
jgi:hypothetical protein